MPCPHCQSTITRERAARTQFGYRTFQCQACERTFNERTGTPRNHLTVPTDVVLQVVLWRLRYKLSLRDLAEMFLERGFTFTHETVREWEARFAPLLADQLRAKRGGLAGRSWYVDETDLKVNGAWCYLYRAIDRDGNLVDSLLSQTRDMEAAQRFFLQARAVARQPLERSQLMVTPLIHGRFARHWERMLTPLQPVSEQPDRARPSRDQTALLFDARVRHMCIGGSLLPGLRGTVAIRTLSADAGGDGVTRQTATTVCRGYGSFAGHDAGCLNRRTMLSYHGGHV